jgi:RND family efflux transporter MFP subunit
MRKNKWQIIVIVLMVITGIGISVLFYDNDEPLVIDEKVTQVRVLSISETANDEFAKYIGVIAPKTIQQATFATIGTIDRVYVTEGQNVKKGALLASIDSQQAQIQVRNAQENLKAADSQRRQAAANMKAEEQDYLNKKDTADEALEMLKQDYLLKQDIADQAYEQYQSDLSEFGEGSAEANASFIDYTAKNVEATAAKTEYDASVASGTPVEVDIAYSRYQAAKASYDAANSQYTIAQNNLTYANNNLESTRLYASMDGFIVKVVSNSGELATPLAPIVVVSSYQMSAIIGVSQSMINTIKTGQNAEITVNQVTYVGKVYEIAKIPDSTSRTYQAYISIDDYSQVNIGETAGVSIDLGERSGIWLMLNTIQNDGEDYVYVVVDDRIVKRKVILATINNQMVLTTGLSIGDLVVIEGARLVRPGVKVKIAEVIENE